MVLDEILVNTIPVVPDAQQQEVIPQNLVGVRHSTRVSLPPKIFSSSLYSILFIDSSEP